MARITQIRLRGHKMAIIYRPRSELLGSLCVRSCFGGRAETLADQGIKPMRKIVLAAAVAVSALGLAACSETAEEAGETADAMAADAEANADAAVEATEEAVDATAEAAAEATDTAEAAAEEAPAE
ncbi:hypothetical protein [Altererythrobacter sp. Z27]|uniref:hypothetical protein n=1 Tax=Altererythrobacter sp. Z27 TaxID=3461147 RepID=UPI0040448C27